jgi:hypothetical protein
MVTVRLPPSWARKVFWFLRSIDIDREVETIRAELKATG